MKPLRAGDLVPGSCYYAPSGRMVYLHPASKSGIGLNSYVFSYMTKNRKPCVDEGFAFSASNAQAIAAMRPAAMDGPISVPRYIAARGIA